MIAQFFAFGLSAILLNKYIIIKNPLFSMGFFNYYQSQVLYPFMILLLISSVIVILSKKNKSGLSKVDYSFLLLVFYNIYFLLAWIGLVAFKHLEISEQAYVLNFLKKVLLISLFIGIYQVATHSSLGLQFIGETNISKDILGLSTINVYGYKIVRAYGTMAHPNILAGYIAILGIYGWLNIFTFSLSGLLAQIDYFKFRIKMLVPVLVLMLIKNPLLNPSSYTERIQQLTQTTPKDYIHNVFLELAFNNPIYLIGYIGILSQIYAQNKQIALSMFVLSMFDHYLITHPQGIMLLAVACMLSNHTAKKQKKSVDH